MAFCWRSCSLERCFFSSLLLLRRNNIPRPGRRAGGVMSWSKGTLSRSVCCCSGRWQHKLEEQTAENRILSSLILDAAVGKRMVRGPRSRRSRLQRGEYYHKVTFIKTRKRLLGSFEYLRGRFSATNLLREQPCNWRRQNRWFAGELLERVQVEVVTFTSSRVRLCASYGCQRVKSN